MRYSSYDVVKLIQQNKQLETLELIELNLSKRTKPDDLYLITLPALHTLTIVGTADSFLAYMSDCLTMPALRRLSVKLKATYENHIERHTLHDLFTDSEKHSYNDLTDSILAPPTKVFVSSSSDSHSPRSLLSYKNGDISIAISVYACWYTQYQVHLPRTLQVANMGSILEELWLRSFSAPESDEPFSADLILERCPLLQKLVVLSATIAEAVLRTLRRHDSKSYSITPTVVPCPLLAELCLFYPWSDKYVVESAPSRSEVEEFLEARQRAGYPLQRVCVYDSRPKFVFAQNAGPSLNAAQNAPELDEWQIKVGDTTVYYCRAYPEDLKLDKSGPPMEPWVQLRRELLEEKHFLEGDEVLRWIPGNYELSDEELSERRREEKEVETRRKQQRQNDVEDAGMKECVTDEEPVKGSREDQCEENDGGGKSQQEAVGMGEEQAEEGH